VWKRLVLTGFSVQPTCNTDAPSFSTLRRPHRNPGITPEHVHRILLALTAGGVDAGAWGDILGACRPALDAEGAI
jgi:hypothetical protein